METFDSSSNFNEIRKYILSFTILVYEKIDLEANKEYICLKNNTAQLYFILGRADLHLIFPVDLGMPLMQISNSTHD